VAGGRPRGLHEGLSRLASAGLTVLGHDPLPKERQDELGQLVGGAVVGIAGAWGHGQLTQAGGAGWRPGPSPGARAVALYLDGTAAPDLDQRRRPLLDDDPLILVNACWEPAAFSLPGVGGAADWQVELDTYDPRRTTPVAAGDPVTVGPRSLSVLRAPR
jgi:hypothetical protein